MSTIVASLICLPLVVERLIDGDTLVTAYGEHVRMSTYDTPETYRPKCVEEMELGERATLRLSEIVIDATTLEYCPVGVDVYFRTLAIVKADGIDVGDILIREGLAQPWPHSVDWCKK